MAELAPVTWRVREDFFPTWGRYGGLSVLTMEPYAFPAARDLVFLPDQGTVSKSQWGLIADLANRLQARTQLILRAQSATQASGAYTELVQSWFEKPGEIVLAGVGTGADLAVTVAAELETNQKPDFTVSLPDFTVPLPDFMLHPFLLPKTAAELRRISDRVWGEADDE